jgi:choice-of-anchor B domain-containing protein
VHSDGREYGIVGTDVGTSIVNITNPAGSYEVAFIPGLASVWREMKQYRSWIYISTEAQGGGIQIVRMTDPENPILVKTYTTNFNRAHTVTVDTTRALLILNGTRMDAAPTGMRILSLADPENPVEVGLYAFDYVHDSWVRNDTLYASCISSATMRIFDLADPTTPLDIVSWTYPGARTHSSEKSKDGRYLYVCDEQNYGTMKVFDMQDVFLHPMVREITVNPLAIVHNVHVKADTAFVAYYTEGIRLFDLTDPSLPAEWGYYDTYGSFSGGFHGVWEVTTSYPSGTFIASDIESGLYVFRSAPNYGTIKVQVRDQASTLLSGVDIVAVGEPDSTRTQGLGTARLALSPGSHLLRVKKFGYQPQILSVTTALGAHDAIQVTLLPAVSGSISGVVRRASDSAPLSDATVGDHGTPLEATSNAAGAYALGSTPPGSYRVVCERPGYAPQERILTLQPGGALTANWDLLRASWYDSCDTDRGWSLSAAGDNAFGGLWIRADPVGTSLATSTGSSLRAPALRAPGAVQHPEPEEGGFGAEGPVQPEDDASPGQGFCFVTSNGAPGGAPGDADVDGGRTTLTTPPIGISGMVEPMIGFQRWYYMNTPGEPDSLLIDISSDGVNWIRARTIRESHPEWHSELIRVRSYIVPGATVRVRFTAQDEGVGSIVEAAVDDLEVHDASLLPTPVLDGPEGAPLVTVGAPWPNPSPGAASITLRLRDAGPVHVAVYDVGGRFVATLREGFAVAGPLTLQWNGKNSRGHEAASGVYWIHAVAGGEKMARRVVLAR